MPLPVVFRQIARQEIDDSISWYESERPGVGADFASEIEKFLIRIADSPEQFPKVRGDIRRSVLSRFLYTIDFLLDSTRIVVLAAFRVKRKPRRLEVRIP